MDSENTIIKKKVSIFTVISIFILTVLTTPSFSDSSGGGLYIISLALSGGGMAWIYYKLGYFWGILASVISYLLSWCLCGSPLLAITTLSVLPCGIAYCLLSKRRLSRSQVIGISGVSVSLIFFAILLFTVLNKTGEFNIASIKTTFTSFFDMLEKALGETFTITVAGQTVPFINSENAEEYINLIIAIMPGIITSLSVILCFVAGWIYKIILTLTHCETPEHSDWKLSPAPITAAFFCVSLMLSAVANSVNVLWIAAVNISLVLIPSFFFAGISSIFEIRFVNGLPRPRILRRILLFASLFIGLPITILLASVFGVTDSIKSLFPQKDKNT